MTQLKICSIDHGFCRIYYRIPSGKMYCIQDEGKNLGGAVMYNCNDWDEPESVVRPKKGKVEIERPTGKTEIEITVNEYIDKFYSEVA